MKDNLKLKTLGPRLAFLVAELHERQKTIFSNQDVKEITGLSPNSSRGLANRLVARGLATRLKPGLFILVPAELGHERDYLGDPYVVAAEIVGGKDYFISHSSAMDIHQMVTQPQFVVYTTTTQSVRPHSVLGTEFRFVLANRFTRAPIVGQVVRARDAFFHGGKSGIGIQFVGLDGMAKVLRDDLLLYLMSMPYQAMWEAA